MVEALVPIFNGPGVLGQRFGQFFGPQTILSNLTVANGATIVITDGTNTVTIQASGGTTSPRWIVPTLNANWSAYGPSPVGYMKDAMGWVHLRGVAINGAGAVNPAFTLPTGFRPSAEVNTGTCAGNGGSFGAMSAASVLVSTNGDVQVDVPAANYYSFLTAVTFLAEA